MRRNRILAVALRSARLVPQSPPRPPRRTISPAIGITILLRRPIIPAR
jgi:hypothetical protein